MLLAVGAIGFMILSFCQCTALALAGSGAEIDLMDAIRVSLSRNPGILLQVQEVEGRLGQFEATGGPFDPTLLGTFFRGDEYTPFSEAEQIAAGGAEELLEKTTSYSVSLVKQFRSGTVLSPNVEVERARDSLIKTEAVSRASVGFQILQPLFRGRGSTSTLATAERAAGIEYEASQSDLFGTVSLSVQATAAAYWDYVAAWKKLDARREAEAGAMRLVEEIRELIAVDVRPRSDLSQAEASLADKTSARIGAEQALFVARQNLGLKMGIPSHEIAALMAPTTPFPSSASVTSSGAGSEERWTGEAFSRRPELKAAKLREEEAAQLVASAKNGMLPRIDLKASVGYAGLDEGGDPRTMVTPLFENTSGVNVAVSLIASLPLQNQEAKGVYRQRKATLDQRKIAVAETKRQIASGVSVALSALHTSSRELRNSEKAVKFYRNAIEDEQAKLKLGMSTILDMINLEDRLTSSMLNYISQHANYAKAVVSFRFETGTLIETSQTGYSVERERLMKAEE